MKQFLRKTMFALVGSMMFGSAALAQTPVYLLDFEGATNVTDFGGIQHGSGELQSSLSTKFGTFYQNWPNASGTATLATNFLEVVPATNPWATLATGLTEFTISFWVNATVANTQGIANYWGSLFTAYTEAGTSSSRTWYYPVGPDLRFAGQFHYNNAGYCDNNHDAYIESVKTWATDNNWHHFAWVFSNLGASANFTLTLYVDGVQKYSINETGGDQNCSSANMLNGLDRFVIGGNSPIWDDPDNAYAYDDIALYNTALTASQIEAIITAKTAVATTISTYGWSTFSSDYALDFAKATEGLEAYMITGHEGNVVTLAKVTGTVPAGTGLLLKGNAGAEYSIPIVGSSDTDVSANLLKAGTGATVSAESGKTTYVLGMNGGSAEFQKITTTAATVAKGKAYLVFNETITAPAMVFDGAITGISAIESAGIAEDGIYYNLSGQRVAQPTKGLYIVNGKKVIVKK